MAKPRASTIQQRFGFQDGDLKTPKHDEMMLWLDANAETISERIVGYESSWLLDDIQELEIGATNAVESAKVSARENAADAVRRLEQLSSDDFGWRTRCEEARTRAIDWANRLLGWRLGDPPEKPSIKVKKRWEYAVVDQKYGGSKYVVGFIDMCVDVWNPCLSLAPHEPSAPYVGEHDGVLPNWAVMKNHHSLLFEVKSTIPSLGELIRQLRMYQTYTDGTFYVVAPDSKYKPTLRSQGIGFVHYPSGEVG